MSGGFPQSYAGAVTKIRTGRHTQGAAPAPNPLGNNVACRRVLLFAENGDTAYMVTEMQRGHAAADAAAVGFQIPQMDANGHVVPLEMWVNNIEVIWIVGAAGNEVVHWVAEEV